MHESWPKMNQRNAKDRANSRETLVLGSEILLWASPIAVNEESAPDTQSAQQSMLKL
jgi:hypothetical protein